MAYGCGESPVDYRDDELDLVEDGDGPGVGNPGDLRDPDDD